MTGFCFGHDTWDIIQESIWNPKCTMCHVSGSSFAEQSGLILTPDVAYDELINVTPQNPHAAEDGLELVGTKVRPKFSANKKSVQEMAC